jgi:hypothetical protein
VKPIIEDRQGFSNAGEFYKFHIERIEKEVEKLSKRDRNKIYDIGGDSMPCGGKSKGKKGGSKKK